MHCCIATQNYLVIAFCSFLKVSLTNGAGIFVMFSISGFTKIIKAMQVISETRDMYFCNEIQIEGSFSMIRFLIIYKSFMI